MTKHNRGNMGNNPAPGSEIAAEPIRELRKIRDIARLLEQSPRDRALFLLGIGTALRASDLVALDVRDVRGRTVIPRLVEVKTGKAKVLTINEDAQGAIQKWLDVSGLGDDDPLFKGQRGRMTVSNVSRMVKGWCSRVGLVGNYSSHTLRKTFGFHQRKTFRVDIPTLMDIFNHGSQRQLLLYLCIQDDEVESVYMNSILRAK